MVFFLMMVPPGMWVPSLTNILDETIGEASSWVLPMAAVIGPIVAIFSSLFFSSLADRKMEAQRLLGILALAGAAFLWMAFSSLKWGWHPGFYLLFQGMNALMSAPMFALITKIMLVNIDDHERKFPIYSLFGTLGWMMAGLLVSGLDMDADPETGRIGAFIRVGMGALCFMLPRTPPAENAQTGWKAALGLNALSLFKNRQVAIFFIVSMLVSIPYVSFYMYAPKMLTWMGDQHQTASMTLGQIAEIFAILLLSALAGRFKMRYFFVVSMSLGVLRFALFALAGELSMISLLYIGLALHGPIYTFMSITGRMFVDKRVGPELRGQAQALYTSLNGSVGGIIGGVFCGSLFNSTVGNDEAQWPSYWWILAGVVLACLVLFILGYSKNEPPILAGDQNATSDDQERA